MDNEFWGNSAGAIPPTGRGRSTRQRLLEAVIKSLNTVGYAATTTQAVSTLAHVSRGSLLHQFSTRIHMMAAAADFAMAHMIMDCRARFDCFASPVEQVRNLALVVEETQRGASALALNEILLAARWEQGLAGHLRLVAENIERVMDEDVVRMALAAGIADTGQLRVRSRCIIASMRGFTIELMFNADRRVIHDAIQVTRADYERFVIGLVGEAANGGDKP